MKTLKEITELKATIEEQSIMEMGKRSKNGMFLLHELFKEPVVTVKKVQALTNLSPKAANDLVKTFVEYKILVEITGYQRNRIFIFERYLSLFENSEKR